MYTTSDKSRWPGVTKTAHISSNPYVFYICNTILLEISNGYVALPGGTMSDVRSG
jgi:hypothetical protein